jgi:hypothetical protein
MSARLALILGVVAVAGAVALKSMNLAPATNTLSDFAGLGGVALIVAGILGYVRRALGA